MPFRFYCSGCGFLLYECGDEILHYQTSRNASKNELGVSPIETFIARKIGDKCPKCGRRLAKKPIKIDVYPIRERKALWAEQKPL
ncbi:MAG: hypothetical protein QXD73_05305 [Candidatus Bathyarchaeia archaeon]